MGELEVASVVTSIVAAFNNGMDVFRRIVGKKKKNRSRARLARPEEEEEWLRSSLSQRPREIQHEYNRSVSRYGRRFEVGDSQAHSTLGHVLLVLNTGLINLINHALAGDSNSRSASQRQLFNLSETAAMETLTALSQLGSRLSLTSQLTTLAPVVREKNKHHDKPDVDSDKKHTSSKTRSSKRPPASPLLVRGGWVRSKSGSSVISAGQAKKVRGDKETAHHRSKPEPLVPKVRPQDPPSGSRSDTESDASSSDTDKPGNPRRKRRGNAARRSSHERAQPVRQPSMIILPGDYFESQQPNVQQQQQQQQQPPPRPPKIPLHSRPATAPAPQRARPTSTMTFMTASTKIGEIPEARWPDRNGSPEEQAQAKMPYTIPPQLNPERKKGRGLRFWKRREEAAPVAAY